MKLTPPSHLGKDGSQFWRDIVSEYGIENGGDKLVHGSGGISQPRAE